VGDGAATGGFADRVLVACVAPPRAIPRAPRRSRSVFAVAALVAASILVPLFLSRSAAPPAIASAPIAYDLGPLQD